MTQELLLPAAVLVAWTLVMWTWMVATRVSGMRKARIHPEKTRHVRGSPLDALPSEIRQVADNYNHLLEQPTIFYAIVLILVASGEAGYIEQILAWAYVGLRIIHSLWQALRNVVMIRFYLFVISTLVLFGLTGRALWFLLT